MQGADDVMTGFGREQQPDEDGYLNGGAENSDLAPAERRFDVYMLYVLGGYLLASGEGQVRSSPPSPLYCVPMQTPHKLRCLACACIL